MVKNTQLLFVKPHQNTEECRAQVKDFFLSKNFTVSEEGLIDGKTIDEKQLIDNHYYQIASKQTILKPSELNVPKNMYKEKFGQDWDENLKQGKIFNQKDACEKLGLDADGLNKYWQQQKQQKKLVKFGGGFYCGLVEQEGKEPIYVMNGFFMSMRSNYVQEGQSIYYFIVSWDSAEYSWEDFRGQLVGATDPEGSPDTCIRGKIAQNWEKMGLKQPCNVGDNQVHQSASPFESLQERMNWVGKKQEDDEFGQQCLKQIGGQAQLSEWKNDPTYSFGVDQAYQQKSGVFDYVEDTDSDKCLSLLKMIQDQKLN